MVNLTKEWVSLPLSLFQLQLLAGGTFLTEESLYPWCESSLFLCRPQIHEVGDVEG